MNTIQQVIAKLYQLDIKLSLDNGKLQVNAPSGALTPELRAELAAHKAELLEFLHQQAETQPIPRANHQGVAPLSYAQQRLWFLAQLETTGVTYHLATLLQLRGALVIEALEASLSTLVERHEILRTTYHLIDDVPVQWIGAPQPVSVTQVDLMSVPPTQQLAQVQMRIQLEQARGFDLSNGPLWRFVLFHLTPNQTMLAIIMHHMITDEWSMNLLVSEFSQLYSAYITGQEANLPALPIQYADYASWQRRQFETPRWRRQMAAWRQQFADVPATLALPTDGPRPTTTSLGADSVHFALNTQLTERLKAISQAAGVTLYTTLLTAYAILLARYSQQDDVVIGSPVANRERQEVESLIGFFVNTMALRIQLLNHPTFRTLLADVRQRVLDAVSNVNMPFEQLVEALQLERHLHRNPIFQTMFVWQNGLNEALVLPNLIVERVELPTITLPVDLLLVMSEERGESEEQSTLGGWLCYSTDLFSAATAERMADHFQYLLNRLVSMPDVPVHTLPLLPPHERQRLLVDWNGVSSQALTRGCLHQLFEAQVARTPQAAALCWGGQNMSYAELNQQANRLAHLLTAQAIGVGARVAICVERSPDMLIAILAVLKSGAAYVPIDPDYPRERLAYLLDDAKVALLLTQSRLAEKLPTGDLPIYLVDQAASYAAQPSCNLVSTVTPDDPIYQIYTSGSTGLPKGVVVSHAGVANTVQAIAQTVELDAGDRLLQFVPFSFDASALEFFATLTCGATLVLHPNPTRLAADELFTLCEQEQITVVNFTVALWQQWVDNLARQGLRFPTHLRVFLVGGDKPAAQTLCTWAKLGDHPMIFLCSYGPTEASITTTTYVTTNEEVRRHPPTTITLGHPLPNTAIYILDANQQLAPIGVTGELYIGGIGVAQGYWQRPDLTRERFLTDLPALQPTNPDGTLHGVEAAVAPVPGKPAAHGRIYRTGDLARWLPDGRCEFVGRVDTQVKIRGFRVELGEIESQLKQLSTVREAAVTALEFGGQDKRIVAYVQPADQGVQQSEIATALQTRLPGHMLPSAWVIIDGWPLTPNGKLDRAALPPPTLHEQSETFVAPSTPLEIELAAIWEAVLGIEAIGIESSFFALGGHSLLATQVVSRIQQQLGLSLPLRTFFEKPTIAELAAELGGGQLAPERPPLTPVDRNGPLPLSFAQQRLWLIAQLDPESSGYSIPGALRLSGRLDAAALQQALNQLVVRHESLRTLFAMRNGEPVQVIQSVMWLPLTQVDLRHVPEAERETAAHKQAAAAMQDPFDLAVGPLLRATLFQLADDESILFVLMHHIVADGWSISILLREVAELYRGQTQGRSAYLPSLPVQYADYAHWQRNWLQGARLQEQIDYWRNELAGAPPLLELPTDHPRPPQPSYQADALTFTLDAELVQGLTRLAHAHGATLYMTVLSAFAILLSRYSRQSDLVIGAPIANRTHEVLEGLIGFFVNTLALRIDLAGGPTFLELLQRVRQSTLTAYAHQDAPFEQVLEALHLPRNLSHAPLFQVMLAWQSTTKADETLDIPGVTLAPVAWQKPTIEFDLALSVVEDDGGLAITWQYSTDLFARQAMTQMVAHFQRLLAAIVEQPTQSIGALPLLSAAEMAQVAAAGCGPMAPEMADLCLHYLFERQALRTPDAPAIFFEKQVISYGELNARANQLAHVLLAGGHGRGQRIAICLERSPNLLVAVLAVLKCGAAYLPLDADYPVERLAYLLADSDAALLLTESHTAVRLPQTAVPICWLDRTAVAGQPTTNPAVNVLPTDPFYQIYTSGSTGFPKGAVVAHAGVSNTIQTMTQRVGLGGGDRLLQFVPLGFDAAAIDMFAPLCCGAAVVIHPHPTQLSDQELLALIAEYKVTVAHFATARWHQFVNNLTLQSLTLPPHLRVFLTGGEKPNVQTLRDWAELAEHEMIFVSSYGPSEASIVAMSYQITNYAARAATPARIPLGTPLPNVAIFLLDEAQQPAPTGVTGEIYIGGVGVAEGYWRRPELTAERFVQAPAFAGPTGATVRLYRTGDLAVRLADGGYEFLGRVDTQVKIRGFRIELGEIENQLRQLPGVREAVVLAVEVGAETGVGDKRIVAYVQTVAREIGQPQLVDGLKQRLPSHMLPAVWVMVEEWPLTPHGKIDRQRLPAPTFTAPDDAYIAPRTPLERELAAIWQTVLGVERVGVESTFFDLGGHSLSAMQVAARIQQQLGLDVPLRTLFEKATISELAAELGAAQPVIVRSPLVRVARDADLPLSFGQQRLWLMQQLNPSSGFFNMPAALWLDGALKLAALQAAFDEMVQRHEILRTTFPLVEGNPVQRIAQVTALPIIQYAASEIDVDADEAALVNWVASEAAQPFDLERGPLVRVHLRQVTSERHLLLVTMHHIIGDDWSRRLFMHEFSALYSSYLQGTPAGLPELAVQYADFAQWQRNWLQGPLLEQQLAYWRTTLADAPPLLELPTDRQRPPQQRFVGERLVVTLEAELAAQLRAFSRQHQSTLHMTLLAGFAALLARYSGMDDLVIGIPVAGRTDTQLEGLIGFFLNSLAIRIRLHGEANFSQLLAEVKRVTLEAYAHQDAPFEQVIEAVRPTPQLSHTPIFQVMFDLAQADSAQLALPGLQVQPVNFDLPTAKFDLNLVFSETADATELTAVWEYNSDIFDHATVAQMARHLEALLRAALAAPTQPVAQLPLLTDNEYWQLIEGWNAAVDDEAAQQTMPQLFEVQAARTPGAIAAYCGDQTITYAELNARANRWAHQLIALGVAADVIVAPFWERNLDFLTAILAIFKAGGAYLPLDTRTPVSRVGQILEQSRSALVLTNGAFRPLVEAAAASVPVAQRPSICLIEAMDSASAPTINPPCRHTLDSLAYVIFTSGSTGIPKGVMVEQRGLVNHLAAMRQNLALTAHDLIAQTATQSYVISVWQFLAALTYGGALRIVPEETQLDPKKLVTTLEAQSVTVVQLVPSLLRLIMNELEQRKASGGELLPQLRWMIPTGEALPPALVRRWFSVCPQIPLLNAYGSSECSDDVAHDLLTQPPAETVAALPIGQPIANVQTYVLDRHGQPAPIGVAGELYVGGLGVGRGYLHDAERTAQLFLTNPFLPKANARLYKTGDRVRRLRDGNIEFLGRFDFQVKVRGIRVELGEIEAVLGKHPVVAQSVVMTTAGHNGEQQLVAYVAPKPNLEVTASALRHFLGEHLPDYMTPSLFVFLDYFPLNASGKVARGLLPAPAQQVEMSSEPYTAPRNQVEATLVEILATVLGIDAELLGVHHNFFDLGGHSMQAIQIVWLLRDKLGVELPLRSIFEQTTVEQLANLVMEARLVQMDEDIIEALLNEVEMVTQ